MGAGFWLHLCFLDKGCCTQFNYTYLVFPCTVFPVCQPVQLQLFSYTSPKCVSHFNPWKEAVLLSCQTCWCLLEHGEVPCGDVLNLERFPIQKLFCMFCYKIQVQCFESVLTENVGKIFFIVNMLFASLFSVIRDENYLSTHLWLPNGAFASPNNAHLHQQKKE